ncbi:hypothetical protein C8R45DRAFT_1102758 [Mycena sanguinolenta]|nr:hypothetical protein C8R45DRAFT_1102758 [Mycena sanguinolenta]
MSVANAAVHTNRGAFGPHTQHTHDHLAQTACVCAHDTAPTTMRTEYTSFLVSEGVTVVRKNPAAQCWCSALALYGARVAYLRSSSPPLPASMPVGRASSEPAQLGRCWRPLPSPPPSLCSCRLRVPLDIVHDLELEREPSEAA